MLRHYLPKPCIQLEVLIFGRTSPFPVYVFFYTRVRNGNSKQGPSAGVSAGLRCSKHGQGGAGLRSLLPASIRKELVQRRGQASPTSVSYTKLILLRSWPKVKRLLHGAHVVSNLQELERIELTTSRLPASWIRTAPQIAALSPALSSSLTPDALPPRFPMKRKADDDFCMNLSQHRLCRCNHCISDRRTSWFGCGS